VTANDNVIMSGLAEESPCPVTSIVLGAGLGACAGARALRLSTNVITHNAANSLHFIILKTAIWRFRLCSQLQVNVHLELGARRNDFSAGGESPSMLPSIWRAIFPADSPDKPPSRALTRSLEHRLRA